MILTRIGEWWQRKFGSAPGLDATTYDAALARVRATRHMTPTELAKLRELVREFMHEKDFLAAEGFELSTQNRIEIAIQACIPILQLGMDAYRRFRSIYVFPDAFRERGNGEWRPGRHVGALAGIAVQGGGVALAWSESERGFTDEDDGYNPIIHEFAHKLDMIDGEADGRPPLPPGVRQSEWYSAFSAAFADFSGRVTHGQRTRMSDYAATNPAEFFAVLSEVYFEEPDVVAKEYPAVYRLLRAFYTQTPPPTE